MKYRVHIPFAILYSILIFSGILGCYIVRNDDYYVISNIFFSGDVGYNTFKWGFLLSIALGISLASYNIDKQ